MIETELVNNEEWGKFIRISQSLIDYSENYWVDALITKALIHRSPTSAWRTGGLEPTEVPYPLRTRGSSSNFLIF